VSGGGRTGGPDASASDGARCHLSEGRAGTAARLALPSRSTSVAEARRFVATGLSDAGVDEEVVETAVLLTSEVVTNAVVHCSTEVQLRLTLDDHHGALVEVLDACALVPMQREPDLESVAGRGLVMVELLASSYGTLPVDSGKVVWFTVGRTERTALPGAPGWSVVEDMGERPVEVRLQGVPVGLYEEMRQHNESLLREYQIHLLSAVSTSDPSYVDHAGARDDLVLVGRARGAVAAAVQTTMRAAGAVAADPAARVDVTMRLSAEDAAACAVLPAVLDRAEALVRAGRFLTRPALPEMLSLRNWLFPEVAAQADGAEPSRWSGVDALMQLPLTPPVEADLAWVTTTDRGVVVADSDNRILAVSKPAAELLGWAPDELAGQRLTSIVPPELREAHVTGYSRHIRTGQARVLDTQLEVPALRRDGELVRVRLRIQQQTGEHPLYLGWLEPADAEPDPAQD
jgi:PAS domain S-box-containing protein